MINHPGVALNDEAIRRRHSPRQGGREVHLEQPGFEVGVDEHVKTVQFYRGGKKHSGSHGYRLTLGGQRKGLKIQNLKTFSLSIKDVG